MFCKSGVFSLTRCTTWAYKKSIIKEIQLTDKESKLRCHLPRHHCFICSFKNKRTLEIRIIEILKSEIIKKNKKSHILIIKANEMHYFLNLFW